MIQTQAKIAWGEAQQLGKMMELTNAQRLGLAMLAEIHKALNIRDGVDSNLVAQALWSKNDWAINWEHGFLLDDEGATPPHVQHVVSVLDMYDFIELSYADLDEAGKTVVADAYPYGQPRFPGFDGNEEGDYYSAARFLIETMGKFSRFKDRDLNSHHPTVATSTRMYEVFEPLRAASINVAGVPRLSAEDIASIMKARHA